MHITEEHLRHMARRHHATMQKLDAIEEKVVGVSGRLIDTLETTGFAWIGGTIEGGTGGWALGPVPLNLLAGLVAIGASHANVAKGRFSNDLNNFGTGLIGSWAAAVGFAFGKRWRETKSLWGGGEGHPFTHPYENGGWPHGAPAGP
jgi:hypothetical protein